MNINLAAYYACFNNKEATEFVLSNFRKHFDNSVVCLISDGGADFSDLANKYNTTYYWMNNIFSSGPKNFYNSHRLIEWWNRQKLVCDISKADYVMILEDDVYIKNKIEFTNDFAIKGVGIHNNNIFTQQIIEDIKRIGNVDSNYYGMCGGSVYNADIFKKIYNDVILDIIKNHELLMQLSPSKYYQLGAVDANITYHFNKRGYNYSEAEWLTEEPNLKERPVIHGWKKFYVK
jgi:hypothetical protein